MKTRIHSKKLKQACLLRYESGKFSKLKVVIIRKDYSKCDTPADTTRPTGNAGQGSEAAPSSTHSPAACCSPSYTGHSPALGVQPREAPCPSLSKVTTQRSPEAPPRVKLLFLSKMPCSSHLFQECPSSHGGDDFGCITVPSFSLSLWVSPFPATSSNTKHNQLQKFMWSRVPSV